MWEEPGMTLRIHMHASAYQKGNKFSQQYLLDVRVVGIIRVWDSMGNVTMPRLTVQIPSCLTVFTLYDMSAEVLEQQL